jgi:hypothetical protein
MKKILTILIFLILCSSCFAANWDGKTSRYVRQGAAGAGSGLNWTDAYTTLPASLVRDYVYYISDGTYAAYTFDDSLDSTKWIYIVKATVADHGTATDWVDSYGDGQAVFGTLTFATSYYEINGQTRNENNWQEISSYGFRGASATDATGIFINANVGNLTFKYIDIGSDADVVLWSNAVAYGVKMTEASSPNRTNIYFGYMHIHNVQLPFHSRCNSYVTIEKCHVGPSWGKEMISHQIGDYWVIRWNKFIDNCALPANEGGTAVIGVFNYTGGGDPADTLSDNWEIYGNVIAGTGNSRLSAADALVLGYTVNNWKFYNNTISHTDGAWGGSLKIWGTGNQIRNTLWYWMGDYNESYGSMITSQDVSNTPGGNYAWCYYKNAKPAYYGADCAALINTHYTGSEDPFIDEPHGNYRLKANFSGVSPKDKGVNLGSPYNIDMAGNVRGADGTWDIGAFEFQSGPTPPSNVRIAE